MKWRWSRGEEEPAKPAGVEPARKAVKPRGPSVFETAMRAADAETELEARTRLVLTAVRELLGRDDDAELARDRRLVQERLVEAARIAPDAALRLLCDVADRCGIETEAGRQALTVWTREPVAAEFARTWFAAECLIEDNAELGVWLANSVRAEVVSAEFRQLARAHLTGLVDRHFERYQFSGSSVPVWQVLYALGPASRSDWFLRLAELADERGETSEAARRYELAQRFGGARTPGKR